MKFNRKWDGITIKLATPNGEPIFTSEDTHTRGDLITYHSKQDCPINSVDINIGGFTVDLEVSMEESIQNIKNIKEISKLAREEIREWVCFGAEIKEAIETMITAARPTNEPVSEVAPSFTVSSAGAPVRDTNTTTTEETKPAEPEVITSLMAAGKASLKEAIAKLLNK